MKHAEIKTSLIKYLDSKKSDLVFIELIEAFLLKKLEEPVSFFLKILFEHFPEETKEALEILAPTLQGQDNGYDSDDEKSEDSYTSNGEDDESIEKKLRICHRAKRRRVCVRGESLNFIMKRTTTIPNNPKTKKERLTIDNTLKKNILLKHFDEEQLKTLESAMFLVTKKFGDIIIKQGDLGDNFYVIDSGIVDVFFQEVDVESQEGSAPKTKEVFHESLIHGKHVERYTAGNFFGELDILYNSPRAATCIATSNIVKLWALDRISFKRILMSSSFTKHNIRLHFLQNVSIFSQLTSKELSTIAESMKEEFFTKGDIIFRQGELGNTFYIVKEGATICLRNDKEVARLGIGHYFCESALMTKKPRQATVIADTETVKCLTLDRKTFNRVMGSMEDILKRNMSEYNKFQASNI